ncbi:MAG TPA: flagellar biosynthesis protein FlhA [Acidimicrobiales bacterium]|nr:flagellar biosynthesis protein FlhA [Acidimicrobiales bacterium]
MANAATAARKTGAQRIATVQALAVPLAVVAVVIMLVIPLPSFILDLLITVNIAASVLVLLTAMHMRRALDFSVFPTLILVATVFRLALNVSATRLVLLHGYAGVVIQSFGHFVVGGSLLVGLVVFLILIIIQFVVITNGAGRVAEVAARFTLDAMPGKQMAVDADLSSGLINQDEARRRRSEIADEADFYGAMDGASKFVRGDAIAAIVITAVNLIGGLAVGVLQHHDPVSQAVSTYSLLSIGDGLVSQIPALLLSLSTGIVVTRAAGDDDLGTNVIAQLSRYRRVVRVTGAIIAVLALVPGLPKIPFLIVGVGLFLLSARLPHEASSGDEPAADPTAASSADTPAQLARETGVVPLELELGMELIDLVDRGRGGDLLERVKALRRNVAKELGIVIPPIHARDNDRLPLTHYAIRVHGVQIAEGSAPRGRLLAVGPGIEHVPGEDTRDPAFGGPAKWIANEMRYRAAVAGATVVDRSAVVTTHLSEVVRHHAGELLSRQDVRILLDAAKGENPAVLEEMTGAGVTLGAVQGVLRGLLAEGIPVRDLIRILEAVTDQAASTKDQDSLLEAARIALGPSIASMHAVEGVLPAITLEPALEQLLSAGLQVGERGRVFTAGPDELEPLLASLDALANQAEAVGKSPVVVCSSRIRPALRRLIRARLPRLDVLGAAEIASHVVIETIGVVRRAQTATV